MGISKPSLLSCYLICNFVMLYDLLTEMYIMTSDALMLIISEDQ